MIIKNIEWDINLNVNCTYCGANLEVDHMTYDPEMETIYVAVSPDHYCDRDEILEREI